MSDIVPSPPGITHEGQGEAQKHPHPTAVTSLRRNSVRRSAPAGILSTILPDRDGLGFTPSTAMIPIAPLPINHPHYPTQRPLKDSPISPITPLSRSSFRDSSSSERSTTTNRDDVSDLTNGGGIGSIYGGGYQRHSMGNSSTSSSIMGNSTYNNSNADNKYNNTPSPTTPTTPSIRHSTGASLPRRRSPPRHRSSSMSSSFQTSTSSKRRSLATMALANNSNSALSDDFSHSSGSEGFYGMSPVLGSPVEYQFSPISPVYPVSFGDSTWSLKKRLEKIPISTENPGNASGAEADEESGKGLGCGLSEVDTPVEERVFAFVEETEHREKKEKERKEKERKEEKERGKEKEKESKNNREDSEGKESKENKESRNGDREHRNGRRSLHQSNHRNDSLKSHFPPSSSSRPNSMNGNRKRNVSAPAPYLGGARPLFHVPPPPTSNPPAITEKISSNSTPRFISPAPPPFPPPLALKSPKIPSRKVRNSSHELPPDYSHSFPQQNSEFNSEVCSTPVDATKPIFETTTTAPTPIMGTAPIPVPTINTISPHSHGELQYHRAMTQHYFGAASLSGGSSRGSSPSRDPSPTGISRLEREFSPAMHDHYREHYRHNDDDDDDSSSDDRPLPAPGPGLGIGIMDPPSRPHTPISSSRESINNHLPSIALIAFSDHEQGGRFNIPPTSTSPAHSEHYVPSVSHSPESIAPWDKPLSLTHNSSLPLSTADIHPLAPVPSSTTSHPSAPRSSTSSSSLRSSFLFDDTAHPSSSPVTPNPNNHTPPSSARPLSTSSLGKPFLSRAASWSRNSLSKASGQRRGDSTDDKDRARTTGGWVGGRYVFGGTGSNPGSTAGSGVESIDEEGEEETEEEGKGVGSKRAKRRSKHRSAEAKEREYSDADEEERERQDELGSLGGRIAPQSGKTNFFAGITGRKIAGGRRFSLAGTSLSDHPGGVTLQFPGRRDSALGVHPLASGFQGSNPQGSSPQGSSPTGNEKNSWLRNTPSLQSIKKHVRAALGGSQSSIPINPLAPRPNSNASWNQSLSNASQYPVGATAFQSFPPNLNQRRQSSAGILDFRSQYPPLSNSNHSTQAYQGIAQNQKDINMAAKYTFPPRRMSLATPLMLAGQGGASLGGNSTTGHPALPGGYGYARRGSVAPSAALQQKPMYISRPRPLDEPPRQYLHQGPLFVVRNPTTFSARYFFLFNDVLVIAKRLSKEETPPDSQTGATHGTVTANISADNDESTAVTNSTLAPPGVNLASTSTVSAITNEERQQKYWAPSPDSLFFVKHIIDLSKASLFVPKEEEYSGVRDPGDAPQKMPPILAAALRKFESEPAKAMAFLASKRVVTNDPLGKAQFLFKMADLDRRQLGKYLSERTNADILDDFCDLFRFTGLRLDEALRIFLQTFRLPTDMDSIEHLIRTFSKKWIETNQNVVKFHDSILGKLVMALLQLNGDVHFRGEDVYAYARKLKENREQREREQIEQQEREKLEKQREERANQRKQLGQVEVTGLPGHPLIGDDSMPLSLSITSRFTSTSSEPDADDTRMRQGSNASSLLTLSETPNIPDGIVAPALATAPMSGRRRGISGSPQSFDVFYLAWSSSDPYRLVPKEFVLEMFENICDEKLETGWDSDRPDTSTEQKPLTIQPYKLPTRLTLGVKSDPITISIPAPDPGFQIKLRGQDLICDPPVLDFSRKASRSFRMTGTNLGRTSLMFLKSGPNAKNYVSELVPRMKTMVVERPLLRHNFQVEYTDEHGVRKKMMFSAGSDENKRKWVNRLRHFMKENPRSKSDRPSSSRRHHLSQDSDDFDPEDDQIIWMLRRSIMAGYDPHDPPRKTIEEMIALRILREALLGEDTMTSQGDTNSVPTNMNLASTTSLISDGSGAKTNSVISLVNGPSVPPPAASSPTNSTMPIPAVAPGTTGSVASAATGGVIIKTGHEIVKLTVRNSVLPFVLGFLEEYLPLFKGRDMAVRGGSFRTEFKFS